MKKGYFTYLGIITTFLIFLAFFTRFADYVIEKNTVLSIYTTCDPVSESCFISDEDNAYFEIQLEPYKKIEVIEKYAPACLEEHSCSSFSCDGIESCSEVLCNDATTEEGEWCTVSSEITENKSELIFPSE